MANAKKVLEELGLSDKESRVYLSLLELGPSPVQKIAQKADVNRVTAYVNLEALSKLGLVSTVEKGKKTLFSAEPPEQLESLIGKKEAELQRKKRELLDALPELKNIFRYAGERPVVKFYEGIEGLLAVREDYLRSVRKNETTLGMMSLDTLFETFPSYEKDATKRRIEKGVRSKIIYTKKDGPIKNATSPQMLREARFVPTEKFPITCDIAIYSKNKISIESYKNKIGVIIEDDDIANTLKVIFNLAWEDAEKYSN